MNDGAIDEATGDVSTGMPGASLQASINRAMGVVGKALSYGRKLHGIEGGDQQAGVIPSAPHSESQRERPMPGPLPPTQNPFGKRTEGESDQQVAGVIPSAPHSESQRERPMPGPLPPTSNPFGKRADAGEEAIPTDDDEEAA